MTPRSPEQNEELREQTRQRIIAAGLELFAENGYANTGIAAVAKEAGISKGLIYHYFDSKEALLGAIFDELIEIGNEIMDFKGAATPAQKIRLLLEDYFKFIEEQTGQGRLIMALTLQPAARGMLKSKIDQIKKSHMVVYIKLFEDLGYDRPELEYYSLGAIMDGILIGYISMGSDYPLQEMKKKVMERYVPD